MARKQTLKNKMWQIQNEALRDPIEIICQNYTASGLARQSLTHKASDSFVELLAKLNITLLVTREYEHLVIALTADKNNLKQSFIHLPHPSGLAVDRKQNSIFIAATRNPTQIWEFKPIYKLLNRGDRKLPSECPPYLMPIRTKFFAGAYYIHDLAIINGELFANSVGQNAIVKIVFNNNKSDKPVWWPKCIIDDQKKPNHKANYIQLNSIAAGPTLRKSFFSASSYKISCRLPTHQNYPVDKNGVILEGNGEIFARGLTRPHSARLHHGKIWLDNSGYGEFGYIRNRTFEPIIKFPAWTRGLCFINKVAFVGLSRVLPRFKCYAPGLPHTSKQICGIAAVELETGKILGSITWPYGNQIFAIDWIDHQVTPGFLFNKIRPADKKSKDIFYSYQV